MLVIAIIGLFLRERSRWVPDYNPFAAQPWKEVLQAMVCRQRERRHGGYPLEWQKRHR